ncbi:NfeD family protein [Geoalkalibacter sp.]|uniref:NfeD family protein n=1 Tax=Geoalkalibacter sp. TaxID=3041440 RepID=UPI00272E3467|nr:NfeD family protein [Geoalkalibacter sp.]
MAASRRSSPLHPSRRGWSGRILLRYALLQLPALGLLAAGLNLLSRWWELPRIVPWLVLGGWLLKDVLLFPLVWRAYDPDPAPLTNTLVGREGQVVREFAPLGLITIQGELWRARPAPNTAPPPCGGRVRVLAMDGLTLVVEAVAGQPCPSDAERS